MYIVRLAALAWASILYFGCVSFIHSFCRNGTGFLACITLKMLSVEPPNLLDFRQKLFPTFVFPYKAAHGTES